MVTRTLQYKCLRPRLKRLLGVIFKSLSVSESCCLYPQHKDDVTQDFRGHLWSHNLQSWYPESQATLLPGPALPELSHPVFWEPALSHPSNEALCLVNTEQHLSDACNMPAFSSVLHASSVLILSASLWREGWLSSDSSGLLIPASSSLCWSSCLSPSHLHSPSRLQFCSPSSGQTFTNPTNKSKCTPQIAMCISEALYHSRRFLRIILWENNFKLHRSKM